MALWLYQVDWLVGEEGEPHQHIETKGFLEAGDATGMKLTHLVYEAAHKVVQPGTSAQMVALMTAQAPPKPKHPLEQLMEQLGGMPSSKPPDPADNN